MQSQYPVQKNWPVESLVKHCLYVIVCVQATKHNCSHGHCTGEKWCCQEPDSELMHGSEVEGRVNRRSRFKLAWRENHLVNLSGRTLAALCRHIPQKVILNSTLAHTRRGIRQEGRVRSFLFSPKLEQKHCLHSWHLVWQSDMGRFTSMELVKIDMVQVMNVATVPCGHSKHK